MQPESRETEEYPDCTGQRETRECLVLLAVLGQRESLVRLGDRDRLVETDLREIGACQDHRVFWAKKVIKDLREELVFLGRREHQVRQGRMESLAFLVRRATRDWMGDLDCKVDLDRRDPKATGGLLAASEQVVHQVPKEVQADRVCLDLRASQD